MSDLQSDALHEFARALPNNLQIKPLDDGKSTVSEALHVRDFPRFLIALESAELDSAAAGNSAPRRSKRLAHALAMSEIEARLLRSRFGRGLFGSKFKTESVAYAAAFIGILSLAWASAGLIQKSPTTSIRMASVDAPAQPRSLPSATVAPAAEPTPVQPEAFTEVGPSLFDPALEDRLSFGAHLDDRALPEFNAQPTLPPPAEQEPVAPAVSDAIVAPVEPATPVATAPAAPSVVMVRNLPPEASLSAGTRISETDWSLSPSDLSGLIVTLPRTTDAALKAEIEIPAPTGVSRIEIRQPADETAKQAVKKAAAPLKIQRRRKDANVLVVKPAQAAVVAPPVATAVTPKAAATPPPAAPPAPPGTAAQAQPSDADAPPAVPPPASEQMQGLLGGLSLLPFWPAPYDPNQPSVGLSADQETMINLGVVPRE